MTRLKPSLKKRARHVLKLSLILCLIYGCSTSITPTYLKENIADALQDICKKEYNIDVKAKLAGQTLWIYLPLEDIFIQAEKPEKYTEKFDIQYAKEEFKEDTLKLRYLIKAIPEREKLQAYKYNKAALEKVNKVWMVLRRVIFSMGHLKEEEPKFFYLITADIKNGFEIEEIFYLLDLKKVSYQFISWNEYQHRTIQETHLVPEILGDKEGAHLVYNEISMKDFIGKQIAYRIKLKFQKPEVDKNVDIDKEILKVVTHTLKIYDFKDFTALELENLLTNNKLRLDKAELLERPTE